MKLEGTRRKLKHAPPVQGSHCMPYAEDMHVEQIDTPAMVVDLDVMESNLRRVADYAAAHGIAAAAAHQDAQIGAPRPSANWSWAPPD